MKGFTSIFLMQMFINYLGEGDTMHLTASQSLVMLGKIISINERLRTLLYNYEFDFGIHDNEDLQYLFDMAKHGEVLSAELEFTLRYPDIIKALDQIEEAAQEWQTLHCLPLYLNAQELRTDFLSLETEIKRQNKLQE